VTGSGGCPAPSRNDPVHAHSFARRRPPLPTGGGCGSAASSPTHRLWIRSAAASPIPPAADPVRCGLLYPTGSGSVISGQESHGGLQSASVPLSLRCCVELPPLPSSLMRWHRTAAAGHESHRPPAGASDLPHSRQDGAPSDPSQQAGGSSLRPRLMLLRSKPPQSSFFSSDSNACCQP
jgi:hypothetical protein